MNDLIARLHAVVFQPANFDSVDLLAARPIVDLDTLFTPPFSVR
jgi:hypothetical protein